MTITHLTGTLYGTDLAEAWIVDGVIRHEVPEAARLGGVHEVSGHVMPGLLDVHTHVALSHTEDLVSDDEVLRRLRTNLAFGVTAIRDAGGQRNPHDVVGKLDGSGVGGGAAAGAGAGLPKVIHCGRHIARPKRYIRYLPGEVEPDGFVAEAVAQAKASDGWIKVVGDWIDRSLGDDADLAPLWPREVLVDAFAAVHELGVKVAVHTFARETIDDLLEAGVDSIEHGTGMTRDHAIEARDRGILVTPTVRQISLFPEFAGSATKYPVYAARMLAMDAQRREHLEMLVDVGSHFLMGSDTAGNVGELGGLPREIQVAVANGMPVEVALGAASWLGRARLGLPTWEDGAPADLVIYEEDPIADVSVVESPAAVFVDGIDAR